MYHRTHLALENDPNQAKSMESHAVSCEVFFFCEMLYFQTSMLYNTSIRTTIRSLRGKEVIYLSNMLSPSAAAVQVNNSGSEGFSL